MGVLFGLIFEKLKRNLHLVKSLADSQTQSDQVRLALALGTSHAGLSKRTILAVLANKT